MALNNTCRWCDAPLSRKKNRTGLCLECYNIFLDMSSEINGSDAVRIRRERERVTKNTCECGNAKDKRAKRCMECWIKVRDPMITEVGKRSYTTPRSNTVNTTLPSTGGCMRSGNSDARFSIK